MPRSNPPAPKPSSAITGADRRCGYRVVAQRPGADARSPGGRAGRHLRRRYCGGCSLLLTGDVRDLRAAGCGIYPTSAFTDLVLAEDRDIASTAATRRHGIASSYAEYRIQRASDKSVRWLSRRGEFIREPTGEPVRFTGTVQDITTRKANEIRQAELLRLADQLREANTAEAAITAAARALGENLAVSSAGYAVIDIDAGIFRVEGGWAKPGAERITGVFTPSSFHVTIDHLKRGAALVTANVSAVSWLGRISRPMNGMACARSSPFPLSITAS